MSEVVPEITGVTLEFLVANPVRPLAIAPGLVFTTGDLAMRQTARPVMWGVAMDVPFRLLEPDVPGVIHALVMLLPGA